MASLQYVAVLATVLLVGCSGRNAAECVVDTNCDLGAGGICTLAPSGSQWCTYPDEACDGGYRYTENAGDGLGDQCVEGTRRTLEVQVGGSGNGTVSTESGFSCSAGTCTGKFPKGAVVNLSAIAAVGTFLGWTDNCRGNGECVVVMDQDRQVGALFGTPGESLWVRVFGGSGLDFGKGIVIDNDNNLIAMGSFSGTITPGQGIDLTSSGGFDLYILKLTAEGEIVWAKRLGEPSRDELARAVAVDELNNIYTVTAISTSGAAVIKLSPEGNIEWTRSIEGSFAPSALAARNNAVVVSGTHGSPANGAGSVTIDGTTYMSKGLTDILLLSLSAETAVTNWVRSFGSSGSEGASGVAIDSSQSVVLSCTLGGNIDFGRGFVGIRGGTDMCLVRLSAEGATLMSRNFGSTAQDDAGAVATGPDDSIFVVGTYESMADLGCTNQLPAQANLYSIFLAKYSQAGACQWAHGFNGPGAPDPSRTGRRAASVAVNDSGDVTIAGSFCGSMSFGAQSFMSASDCSSPDAFAARFSRDGVHLNSVRAGGTSHDVALGIAQSADGRFFVTGQYAGFAEFGGEAHTSTGSSDVFIWGLEAL